MDLIKVNGIVVKSSDYKDNDRLVTLVTFELGRITCLARGVKKPKAKLKYAQEVFNFGEFMLAKRNDSYTLTDCVQTDSFGPITKDIEMYYCGCMMMDILSRISSLESQKGMLAQTIRMLSKLCYDEEAPQRVTTEFLKECLRQNGYDIDYNHCSICGTELTDHAYFLDSAGLICSSCANKSRDIPVNINILKYLQNGEGSEEIAKVSNAYLAYFLEELVGIKANPMYFGNITYGE